MSTAANDTPPFRYTAALAGQIEARWQDWWDEHRTFQAPNPGEPGFDASRPKQFVLDMFPYPSGAGIHVGHPLGYIATDIYARYLRMTGHNVLHAMGYDSFGLPAEQYAVQTNTHPRVTTEANIANMRRQLRRMGLGHDARRSVSTTDEAYYKWTQWIFLQIYNSWYDPKLGKARPIRELVEQFERGERPTHTGKPWSQTPEPARHELLAEHRLAFLAEVPVNWCPMLGTVLANEEVTNDGKSERGNYPVYKRPLKQWMMRITSYADRLLTDLDPLAWPDPIKMMQRNWIGRSEGAYVDFDTGKRRVRVFTTRPDTLFGATYMVLSPEHEMVDQIVPEKYGETAFVKAIFPGSEELLARSAGPAAMIAAYRTYAKGRTDDDRTAASKDKTGVFTGAYAVNPVNNQRIPIFIADYVLAGYGTGAIMAVPAHDERDFEFATEFKLPIRDVVYSRLLLAMKYFADNAAPHERGAGWMGELADLLGLVVSQDAPPAKFAEILNIIRTRRKGSGDPSTAVLIDPGTCAVELPGAVGQRRGSTRITWLDVFEDFKFTDFEDFKTRFDQQRFNQISGTPSTGDGFAVNSPVGEPDATRANSINGLTTAEAKKKIGAHLRAIGRGEPTVTYKLRDWLFSRQRYWGEPFPIVFDEQGLAHAVPESQLPVKLPEITNFQPESSSDPDAPPRPPLARASEWMTAELDLGDGRGPRTFTREANTMPNWAGSCWYYLRYLDPEDANAFVAPEIEKYWMLSKKADGTPHIGGVDLYVGGVEHAVLHLLYARFWHKVLFDLGHVSTPEPFGKLFNQGYIQAAAYTDVRGVYVPAEEVTEGEEVQVDIDRLQLPSGEVEPVRRPTRFSWKGEPVFQQWGKMGKSLKNAVAPDEVCAEYGCDTLRVYEMSMGPLEASKPWNTRDIAGSYRFLQRVWRNLIDEQTGSPRVTEEAPSPELLRSLHKTIAGVRSDMAGLGFNTVVAKLIELNNELTKAHGPDAKTSGVPRAVAEPLALMLAPLAPHMAEELWRKLGHNTSIAFAHYPSADLALAADDEIEIPVQVLGKLRGRIKVPAKADNQAYEAAALACAEVKPHIEGKQIKKVIVVPGKMVNLVVG